MHVCSLRRPLVTGLNSFIIICVRESYADTGVNRNKVSVELRVRMGKYLRLIQEESIGYRIPGIWVPNCAVAGKGLRVDAAWI